MMIRQDEMGLIARIRYTKERVYPGCKKAIFCSSLFLSY
jgi:hypothetical protein